MEFFRWVIGSYVRRLNDDIDSMSINGAFSSAKNSVVTHVCVDLRSLMEYEWRASEGSLAGHFHVECE